MKNSYVESMGDLYNLAKDEEVKRILMEIRLQAEEEKRNNRIRAQFFFENEKYFENIENASYDSVDDSDDSRSTKDKLAPRRRDPSEAEIRRMIEDVNMKAQIEKKTKRKEERRIRHEKRTKQELDHEKRQESQIGDLEKYKEKTSSQENNFWRRKKYIFLLVFVVASIAPASVTFYHFVLKKTTIVLSTSPTQSPTFQGDTRKPSSQPKTQLPTKDLRIDLVDFLRSDYGVNIPTDSSAPIQKAVDWLAEEAQIDGNLDLSKKTFQRFTLLVFYYSLLTTDLEIETEVASYLRSDNMLFDLTLPNWGMRKQDECMWPGVSCNESGNVKMIKLNDMAIQGTIATELGFLTDLIHFDMSNNKLEGTIPEELYDLEDMEQLFLYDNQIGGTISTKIGDLWKLTHYQLSQNQLTGTIPETLKSSEDLLRSIRYFNVQRNQLTGTIPYGLRLRNTYYFDLGSNKLVGTVPEDLGEELVRARHLYLDHNRFTGTIPSSIINAGDGHLRSLALNDNQFTGDLPGDHEQIRKMDQLMVQNNNFVSMSKNTCEMSVFSSGELIEFKSDCDICACQDFMCEFCT